MSASPQTPYEDARLDAVLRRVLMEHRVWEADQPLAVRRFFDNGTFGDDVESAMEMIRYGIEECGQEYQRMYVNGGVYGMLVAVLRVIEMTESTPSVTVASGRATHALLGERSTVPIMVCSKNFERLSNILEAVGYGLDHDKDFIVMSEDGDEVLRATHGEYIQVTADGSVVKSGRET